VLSRERDRAAFFCDECERECCRVSAGELVPYRPAPVLPLAARRLAVAAALCGVWGLACWVAGHVEADPPLHRAALFLHLASLVVGLGAVLRVDWEATLWLMGRRTLADVLRLASGSHTLIWTGLAGLVLSGVLLHPDLDAPLTQAKLAAVLLVALNGVQAHCLQDRLDASRGRPSAPLVLWSSASAGVSQLGWWSATLVGFVNAQA
jgi:hypothetical protein